MGIPEFTLEGRVTRLTPLAVADVDGLVAAANEDRSAYGYTSVPADRASMTVAVETLLTARDRGHDVPFVTRTAVDDRIVGATRFLWLRHYFGRPEPDAVEIGGTWLAASAQRTAVNTEAKLLMLTHAFEAWGVQRVDLKTDARNERSRAAIERIGARLDGVLRAWQPSLVPGEEGQPRDSALYSILPAEWPAVRMRLRQRRARLTGRGASCGWSTRGIAAVASSMHRSACQAVPMPPEPSPAPPPGTGPGSRGRIVLLGIPMVAFTVCTYVGNALAPTLAHDTPLLLLGLSPKLRWLFLVSPTVDVVWFFALPLARDAPARDVLPARTMVRRPVSPVARGTVG